MKPVPKKPSRDYKQLQQIIVGLTDGVILVSTDQKILWANDAALTMHGVRRIKDLGATVGEYRRYFRLRYRNNRPVERGRYPIERVISGESFNDVTVEVTRSGKPDRCWVHSIRSLVITDDSKEPDYLVLIIKDETERFEAEERFESAFNANPAPAIICRLSDLCFVRVNQGFLEMTGYDRNDLLGRSIREIDVLGRGGTIAISHRERLKEGKTIPQMEACLPLPDGGHQVCDRRGRTDRDRRRGLYSLHLRRPGRAQERGECLAPKRGAVRKVLSSLSGSGSVCKLARFKLIEINEAFKTLTGYGEEEVVGRSPAELRLWADKTAQRQFEQAVERTGSIRNLDLQLRAKDESIVDCLVSADTVIIHDERCVLCVMQDITDRKRTQDELVAAIEAVMADTSWFSRTVVEKLAALRQSSRAGPAGADLRRLDRPRARSAWPDLPGPKRRGNERDAEVVAQHDPQSRVLALPQDRRQPACGGNHLGA